MPNLGDAFWFVSIHRPRPELSKGGAQSELRIKQDDYHSREGQEGSIPDQRSCAARSGSGCAAVAMASGYDIAFVEVCDLNLTDVLRK